jgi:hypothetical protein
MELRRKAGAPLNLPEPLARRDLLDAMMADDGIGWASVGMDHQPLPWSEIIAFAAHQGLDEWERGTIRALSMAYLDGRNSTAEPNAQTGREGKLALAEAIRAGMRR